MLLAGQPSEKLTFSQMFVGKMQKSKTYETKRTILYEITGHPTCYFISRTFV